MSDCLYCFDTEIEAKEYYLINEEHFSIIKVYVCRNCFNRFYNRVTANGNRVISKEQYEKENKKPSVKRISFKE